MQMRATSAVTELDSTPDDRTLVVRALGGDRWAEEALYKKHVRRVFGVVIRLLGKGSDAEDVVQDTFVIALDELSNLRNPAAFGGWVCQIAVRQVHRRFRRRKLRRVLGLERSDPSTILESQITRDASPELRAEVAALDRALHQLPAEQRTAWVLRHVEGHSLDEVAQACECSLATVKRRISAAHTRLLSHVKLAEPSHE